MAHFVFSSPVQSAPEVFVMPAAKSKAATKPLAKKAVKPAKPKAPLKVVKPAHKAPAKPARPVAKPSKTIAV